MQVPFSFLQLIPVKGAQFCWLSTNPPNFQENYFKKKKSSFTYEISKYFPFLLSRNTVSKKVKPFFNTVLALKNWENC